MENHTVEILEFNQIKESLKSYCLGEGGAHLIDMQLFTDSNDDWYKKSEAVDTLLKLFKDNISIPELSFPYIDSFLSSLTAEGSVLEQEELSAVMVYLGSSIRLKKVFFSAAADNDTLISTVSFEDTTDIENKLKKYLRPDGTLKEDSIKELVAIKKRIGTVNRSISSTVNSYVTSHNYSSYLQDTSSALKDGRVVLPVKGNFKGKIKGIVHGKSAKGLTFFIEPMDLVEQNNELTELEELYKIEIFKILKKLSELLRENLYILKDIIKKISEADSYIARARFAYFNNHVIPEIKESGINLKNARHFLLGKNAVPINISISDKTKALVISGPNTGGKTLALKTAGLAVLMNQFWMGLPADEGSSIALFDNVLADIGDEQSVTGSLSTFSAHMKNVSEILGKSTERSLVLLDEPGTGTDPEEGAALSISFIQTIISRQSLLMVSTHQGVIKNFATANPYCENVSVAYDPETYRPEYSIIYGLPGESYGIDIAMKNGIPEDVIELSRKYLGSEKVNINKLLKDISEKQQIIDGKMRQLDEREHSIKEDERKIMLKEISIRQKRHELKIEEERKTSRFLRESRKKVENAIREIREGELTKNKILRAKEIVAEIENRKELISSEIESENALSDEIITSDFEIKEGMSVLVGDQRVSATIIRKAKKDRFLVSTGSMRLEVSTKDIFPDRNAEKKVEIKSYVKMDTKPVFELDLRGMRLDDAVRKLQQQIDTAVLANFKEFSVIHGLGEGILQKGVWNFLETCCPVKNFNFAHPDQGGFGKTVVYLK